MLNFFRKIRKSLIESGSTRKYLFYAFGEIALVVIGILIALQINNWNEWRKDREIEAKTLLNLVENLELNIQQIEYELGRINEHNLSGTIIISGLDNRNLVVDTFSDHIHSALLNHSNLVLSEAGYESLKNVGFEIITNDELKKEIVLLHENTYLHLYRNQVWGAEVKPDLDKYLIDKFTRYQGREWIPRDFESLINDHYFHGLLNIASQQRGFYQRRYNETLVEIVRVLQLIKEELGSI
jgi:hypothetical protein